MDCLCRRPLHRRIGGRQRASHFIQGRKLDLLDFMDKRSIVIITTVGSIRGTHMTPIGTCSASCTKESPTTRTRRLGLMISGLRAVSANAGSNGDWHFPQQLEFGAYNDNSENSKGQIAEFVMYYGMLTDEQRQKIESHLAYKYALDLDANHPFGDEVDALEETVDAGGAPTTVTLYWGTADGGTGSWQNTETLSGTHDKGVVGKDISGLTNGTTYYYRAKASNSVGAVWASETKTFKATNTLLNKDSVPDLVLWLSSDDADGNGLPDSLSDGSLVHDWKDKSNGGFLVQQAPTSSALSFLQVSGNRFPRSHPLRWSQ